MASKVFVHVGAPLTPAITLRDGLARHRRRLARVGVLYPPGHLGYDGGHREAVLDALSLTADQAAAPGAWDRLAESVRDWRRGTAVVSHELLADATEPQVDRIVSSLGSAEVHVVYVAQDLGRQLPRAWQQWVHNGGTVPFSTYSSRVLQRESHRIARVFWRSHDLGEVLDRWATRVPADRIHVVTAGQGVDETWARFTRTLGLDPLRFRLGGDSSDGLAALAGTEVVRLLNVADATEGGVDPARLAAVIEHSRSVAGAAPRLPAALGDVVARESGRMVETVRTRGWRLAGPAEDLETTPEAFAAEDAEVVPPSEAVVRAQTEVLLRLATPRRENRGPAGVRRRALRMLRERVRP